MAFRTVKTSLRNIRFLGKLPAFLLILIVSASAENPEPEPEPLEKPISRIIIVGNDMTDENVIRRELLVREGRIPSHEELEMSRRRIQNLFLFNRVEMYVLPDDSDQLLLIIEVTERVYFYPVPILTINDRDWTKWSYGLSVVHYNFRGQNEKVWGGAWFGFRPGFGFSYSDNWAGDSLHLTTGLAMNANRFNHRTLEFEERHISGQASVGKWWGFHFKTDATLRFDRVSVDEPYREYMNSGETTEDLWGIEFGLLYDSRDLYAYPGSGWFTRVSIYMNGIFQEFNNYYDLRLDLRKYQRIFGPVILAGRFYQSYLFDQVPVYRLNYLGFNERVRGKFNEVREGRHLHMSSLEIRFPIIPVHYFSMQMPIVPDSYLKNLSIGLSGGVFADAGIIWDHSYEYGVRNYLSGFGFGLHIHMPYVEIFRIDYAFDVDLNDEFIVEIGVAF